MRAKKWQTAKTESNQETGTKEHLWPPGMFYRLLVLPKCICGRPEPLWGTYSAPPDSVAAGEGLAIISPITLTLLSAFEFQSFRP